MRFIDNPCLPPNRNSRNGSLLPDKPAGGASIMRIAVHLSSARRTWIMVKYHAALPQATALVMIF